MNQNMMFAIKSNPVDVFKFIDGDISFPFKYDLLAEKNGRFEYVIYVDDKEVYAGDGDYILILTFFNMNNEIEKRIPVVLTPHTASKYIEAYDESADKIVDFRDSFDNNDNDIEPSDDELKKIEEALNRWTLDDDSPLLDNI